ncbi:MAG: PASTA domain-containing protein [Lentisphaeria bacterium]|nr:PASTA domain-containing protein [Lentisphaeria bacterium]
MTVSAVPEDEDVEGAARTLSGRAAITEFLKRRLSEGKPKPIRYYTYPRAKTGREDAAVPAKAKVAPDPKLVAKSYRTARDGATPEAEFKAFMDEVGRIASGTEPSGQDVLRLLQDPKWRDRLIRATLNTVGPNGEGAPKAIKQLLKVGDVHRHHGQLMWFARNELIRQTKLAVLEILRAKHPDMRFEMTMLDSGTAGSVKSDVDKTPWLAAWDGQGKRVPTFGEGGRVLDGDIHAFVRLFYGELDRIGKQTYGWDGAAKCLDVEFFPSDTLPRRLGLARTHLEADPFRIAVDQNAADFRVLQQNPGPTYQTRAAILAQVPARAVDADAQLAAHAEALEAKLADWARVDSGDRLGLLLDHAVDLIHAPAMVLALDENGTPRFMRVDVITFLQRNGLATRFDRNKAVMAAIGNYEKLLHKVQKIRGTDDFKAAYHDNLNDVSKYLTRVNFDHSRGANADTDPDKPKAYGDLDRAYVAENARTRHLVDVEPLGRPYTKDVHRTLYRKALAKLYASRPEGGDAGRSIDRDIDLYWAVHRSAENAQAVKADEKLGQKMGSLLAAQKLYPDDFVLRPLLDHLAKTQLGFSDMPLDRQLDIARRTMVDAGERSAIILIAGRLDEAVHGWLVNENYEIRELKANEHQKREHLQEQLMRLALQEDAPGTEARRTRDQQIREMEVELHETRSRLGFLEGDPAKVKKMVEAAGMESIRRIYFLFKRKGDIQEYRRMLQLLPEAHRQGIVIMERVWEANAREAEKTALEEFYGLKPPPLRQRAVDATQRMARAYMEDFGVDLNAFFARAPTDAEVDANAKPMVLKRFFYRNYVHIGLADSALQFARTFQLSCDLPWDQRMEMLGHTTFNEFIMGVPALGPVYTMSLGVRTGDWKIAGGGVMSLTSEMTRLWTASTGVAMEEAMIAAGQGGRAAALGRMAGMGSYATVALSMARVGVEIVGDEIFYPIDQHFLQLVTRGYADRDPSSLFLKVDRRQLRRDIPITPIVALESGERGMAFLYLKPAEATDLLQSLFAAGNREAAIALLHSVGRDENMDRSFEEPVVIDLRTDYLALIERARSRSFGSPADPLPPRLMAKCEAARTNVLAVWGCLAALRTAVLKRIAEDEKIRIDDPGHLNLWLLASRQNLAGAVQPKIDLEVDLLYQAMVGVPQAREALAAATQTEWLPAGRGQQLPEHIAAEIRGVLDTRARFAQTHEAYKNRVEELQGVPWGMPQDMLREYTRRQTQAWLGREDEADVARQEEIEELTRKLNALQIFLSNRYVNSRTPTQPYRLDAAMAWYGARLAEIRGTIRQAIKADAAPKAQRIAIIRKGNADRAKLMAERDLLAEGFHEVNAMVAPKVAQHRLKAWLAGAEPFNNAVHTALTFVWHDARVQGMIRGQVLRDILNGKRLEPLAANLRRTYQSLLDAALHETALSYARETEDRVRRGFAASLEWAPVRAEAREKATMFDGEMELQIDPSLMLGRDEQGVPTLDVQVAVKVDHEITRVAVPEVQCSTTILTQEELKGSVPAAALDRMLEDTGLAIEDVLFAFRITGEVVSAPPLPGFEDRSYTGRPKAVTRYILIPGKVQKEVELAPETAAVQAFPVKPDAPDRFPMAEAADHCVLDVRELNEYDEVVVFFTPKRDLHEDHREEFRYRLLDGAGKWAAGGDWRAPQEGKPSPTSPVRTRAGSPGLLAINHALSLQLRAPGTYVLETARLKRTVGVGLFGQGQGYEVGGEWQEEGRFEVLDGKLHFQGFVAEPCSNRAMPRRTKGVKRWGGTVNMEMPAVDVAAGIVSLDLSARWTPATAKPDGTLVPVDREWQGRTKIALTYPSIIQLGRVENPEEARRGDTKNVVAEIGVDWTVEGGAYFKPQFLPPTPIRTAAPSRAPFEREDGIKLLSSISWPHTIGLDYWLPEAGRRSVFMICKVFTSEVFGAPPQGLAWHIRNREALWVLPIRLVFSDDVQVYGFAVYKAKPGTYDGPAPAGLGDDGQQAGTTAGADSGDENGTTTGTDTAATDAGGQTGQPGRTTTGTTATTGGGETGTGDQPRPDPATLDPDRNQQVAALIREWTGVAAPPGNATIGADLHYTEWGVKAGTVPGGIIKARGAPDAAGGRTSVAYRWSVRTVLDSVDHGTLEEYVLARLAGASLAGFRGRYKPKAAQSVANFRDLPAAVAQRKALLAGFKARIVLGGLAGSAAKAYTVEEQAPWPGESLTIGSEIQLRIRRKPSIVPDVLSLPAREAVNLLRKEGLQVRIVMEGNAPDAAAVNRVRRQVPKKDVAVLPGTRVHVYIHGPVRTAVPVPDCRRLPLAEAMARLRQAGLKPKPRLDGAAPTREQENQVWKQVPQPGTKVAPETTVQLHAFAPIPVARVPLCRGLTIAAAQAKVGQVGLTSRVVETVPPLDRARAGQVHKQVPASGSDAKRGTLVQLWVYGAAPVQVRVPECRGVTVAQAASRLRQVGLASRVEQFTPPHDPARAGLVRTQVPAAGNNAAPGSVIRLWAYGAAPVRPVGVVVPNLQNHTTAQAAARLRQVGLKMITDSRRLAPRESQIGLIWRQTPNAGVRLQPGATVRVEVYGKPPPPKPSVKPVLHLVFPPHGGGTPGHQQGNKILLAGPNGWSGYLVRQADGYRQFDMNNKLVGILKQTWHKADWDGVYAAVGGEVRTPTNQGTGRGWHAILPK